MSIECGECERDARGGHDEDCSRHPMNRIADLERQLAEAREERDKANEDRDFWKRAADSWAGTAGAIEARAEAAEAELKSLRELLAGVLISENDQHRQSDDRWSVFRQQARAVLELQKEPANE